MGLFDSFFGGGDDYEPRYTYDQVYEETKLTPSIVNTETSLGTGQFVPGEDGSPGSLTVDLNPALKQGQQSMWNTGAGLMQELAGFSTQDYAKNYFQRLENMQGGARAKALTGIKDQQNLLGRGGLAVGMEHISGPEGQNSQYFHANPEMSAYYNALLGQQQKNAMEAEQAGFQRFGDIMRLANYGYDAGIGYAKDALAPMRLAGEMQGDIYRIDAANKENLRNARFAQMDEDRQMWEDEQDDGGFFDKILDIGINAGVGYLTGGPTGAIIGGANSAISGGANYPTQNSLTRYSGTNPLTYMP